jgi:hypothetical protein
VTWFRADDGWHKHRKRIMCGMDLEGFAARGLWLDAGTWCADELTDGWLPAYMLDYLCPGFGRDLAKRLERARLWEPEIRDGEEGWQYHDWADFQPMRDEIMAQREKKTDGGKLGNHRRWHVGQGKTDPRCVYCRSSESDPIRTPSPVSDGNPDRSTDGTTDSSPDLSPESGPNPPDPARPVPSRPVATEVATFPSSNPLPPATRTAGTDVNLIADVLPGTDLIPAQAAKADNSRGTRLPADWVPSEKLRTWAVTELPGFNTRAEHPNFVDHWIGKSGRDATKRDWDATWRKWMREAARRAGWRPNTPQQTNDGRQIHARTGAHLDHLSRYGDLDG